MKASKIIFIYLISIFSLSSFCEAQNKTAKLANDQEVALLTNIELNNATVYDTLTIKSIIAPKDWSIFNQSLGEPKNIEEKSGLIEDYITIEYEGIQFEYSSYTGTFELAKMTIQHSKYWITIDEKKVYPGMDAEDLQKLFNQAFKLKDNNKLRFYIAIVDQEGQLRYQDGKPIISDITSLVIELNQTTQSVEKIILERKII